MVKDCHGGYQEDASGNPVEATEDNPPLWSCSFTGYLRLYAGAYGGSDADKESKPGLTNFAYAIMYIIMVIYTVIFTFMYIRRVLYMAFLTMVAPLIALTYPLDKIKDSKAQALGLWLREYIFNALMQPLHLILYIMVVSNVMNYVTDHPVYAIVALGFLLSAEKFFRKMFGFEKADTFDDKIANTVGGVALMRGASKLSKFNKPRQPQGASESGSLRTADSSTENIDPLKVDKNAQQQQQQLQALRNKIQKEYKKLVEQGVSNEEISQKLHAQFNNKSVVNDVINQNTTGGSGAQQGSGQTSVFSLPQMPPPQITGAIKKGNTERGFGSKMAAGFMNVVLEGNKRRLKSKPLKTLGKYTGMAIGGATLGIVGLAAGIATGEFDNTLKFTASGMGIGSALGGTWSGNVMDWTSEQKEYFKRGYYGNKVVDTKKFLSSEELRSMVNDRDIYPEMRGEIDRMDAINEEARKYYKEGIKNTEIIAACIKAGLTLEEGLYAIELAKIMKKGKVKTKTEREAYRKKYESAFQNQSISTANKQKINDIWDTATRIRFK